METFWMIEIQGNEFLSVNKLTKIPGIEWSADANHYLTFPSKEIAQKMLDYLREKEPAMFPSAVKWWVSEHKYLPKT